MLTYKKIRISFYLILALLFAGYGLFDWNIILPVLFLFVIYLLFIAWGAYFIQSGFFLKAICTGNNRQKQIALTFDDGPDKTVTPMVLELLKTFNAKATFFCIGKNIGSNEKILKQICNEGHEIGNHSFSHSYLFDLFRGQRVEHEILHTNEIIEKATGIKVRYFRPPFGVTNPVIADVIKKLNIPVVGWSIRSYDTTIRNQEKLFNRVTNNLKPGDILLFHDTNDSVIDVLKRFLLFAQKANLKVVTVSDILKENAG